MTEIGASRSLGLAPGATALPAPRAVIDYDFQSVLAAAPRQRLVLWLMVGMVLTALAGLALARVDIIIAANGQIITSDSQIVVQPLDTSIIRSVTVRPGDKVTAGTVLATLDPTFTDADAAELTSKLRSLQAAYDRLDVELAGRAYDPATPNAEELTQRDIFRKRQQEYAAKLDSSERKAGQYSADLAAHKIEAKGLGEQIGLVGQQEQMYKTLVNNGWGSKLKQLEATQRLVDAKGRLDTNLGEQRKLAEQIAEAEAERDAFVHEWRRKLAEELAQTRADRDAAAARRSKVSRREDLSVLRAPADAIVLEMADRPAGSVVREAETLMRLVPTAAPLIAEVQVDTRDVARLHVGDRVTLKFEALPWQQYGLAYGVLRSLTPDVLPDGNARETAENMNSPGLRTQQRQSTIHYRGRVEVTETKFRNLPDASVLRPGLRLVADIKVGRRSMLGYILNPITRVIDESMREP
jgi:HlyD family secretion protein